MIYFKLEIFFQKSNISIVEVATPLPIIVTIQTEARNTGSFHAHSHHLPKSKQRTTITKAKSQTKWYISKINILEISKINMEKGEFGVQGPPQLLETLLQYKHMTIHSICLKTSDVYFLINFY